METTTAKHTAGAIRAAEIITSDNYDAPMGKYHTDHGIKTVVGVADLIDRETSAATMLDALDRIASGEFSGDVTPSERVSAMRQVAREALAIARATS